MRRACLTSLHFAVSCRWYRTPLGGLSFEQPLPASLGAKSTANKKKFTNKSSAQKLRRRERLAAPLTAEGLRAQLRRLAADTTSSEDFTTMTNSNPTSSSDSNPNSNPTSSFDSNPTSNPTSSSDSNPNSSSDSSSTSSSDSNPNSNPNSSSDSNPNSSSDSNSASGSLCSALALAEGGEGPAVLPGSTVLAGDLDAVERHAARAHRERAAALPPLSPPPRQSRETKTNAKAETNANAKAETNAEAEAEEPRPAAENPHFPVESAAAHAAGGGGAPGAAEEKSGALDIFEETNAATEATREVSVSGPGGIDAARGVDHWADSASRALLQQHVNFAADAAALEALAEGAVDTAPVDHSAALVRRETLLYFQAHPINEMIQEPFVRIRAVEDASGNSEASSEDEDVPVAAARRRARALGLDLLRVGTIYSQRSDRRVIALCIIADHRVHLREMLRFKLQKHGVQPPPVRPCIEVPFRGGTHPHALRFKSVGIAKHLLRGHVVRVNITDFGTPREGFPALRAILDAIREESLRLKAFHSAGTVRATYDEIFCYLFPSTGRSPKTDVKHPSDEELRNTRDTRILEDEREIYFDDLRDQPSARARLAYEQRLQQGTAWAAKDAGLSLQRQRSMKVMLGFLPKGNREMYAARGDVDIPAPFRASHPTSTSRWTNPPETNVEQASRGAAVLGQRHSMTVSEMHDRGETADSPATLDRFYYRLQGPALEAGELKEAFGLKRNRKTVPRAGPGWGTLGVAHSQADSSSATK